MRTKASLGIALLACIISTSCGDGSRKPKDAEADKAKPAEKETVAENLSFTDPRDGKKYKIVIIGEQTWMAENLNYEADGSKCYDNEPANCKKYGRLYDWKTAKTACPSGWHLPSKAEWEVMTAFIGGESAEGRKLKAKSGWNGDGNGTDEYGFSALPGGGGGSDGSFFWIGYNGIWWSSSELNSKVVYDRNMGSAVSNAFWGSSGKGFLRSVRCLQGGEAKAAQEATKAAVQSAQNTFTDPRDKKTYKTVKIGTQTWMAENLNYAEKDSKCYDNKPANCTKYGRLYDWETADKACPSGWHLPSEAEWTTLKDFAGGEKVAGKKLKAKSGWNSYEGKSGNGTDEYGFSALPGGYGYSDGSFSNVGSIGHWWSSGDIVYIDADSRSMYSDGNLEDWINDGKSSLFSVRCLQD